MRAWALTVVALSWPVEAGEGGASTPLGVTGTEPIRSARAESRAVFQQGEEPVDLERGRAVYRDSCEPCHGREGDGAGPQAAQLTPLPRNFVSGSFKFRSTASGDRPLLEDVIRTVTTGLKGTWMPAFGPILPKSDLRAVSAWVLAFGPKEEPPERLVPAPGELRPLADTPALRARGKELYESLQCGQCHGPEGRGDGPAAATAVDSQGHSAAPLDFTVGLYKGGSTPEDVYRTFVTGLDGTPMPSYGDSLPKEEDRWALVHYVRSLSRSPGIFRWLFGPRTPWE